MKPKPRCYTLQVEHMVFVARKAYNKRIGICVERIRLAQRVQPPREWDIYLPSRNGLLQMGQLSAGWRDFLGTRSSSAHGLGLLSLILTDMPWGLTSSPSRNSCPTPCTSLGGISASPINCCLICSKRSLPLSSSRLSMPNASASMRNGAATLTGVGTALLLETLEVSICSRAEKMVERSGRRGGWFWEVSACWLEMLCSTDAASVANVCMQEDSSATFVTCHLGIGTMND